MDSSTTRLSVFQKTYDEYIAKIRHNQYPFSSLARLQLRSLIEVIRNELRRCSDRDDCNLLLRTLECQKSLLSPIRKLPPEILDEIFRIAAIRPPGYNIRLNTNTPDTNSRLRGSVFTLTWVCHWWRHQTIAQPALWSSLSLQSGANNRARSEVWAFLKECILRSGDFIPLDLQLAPCISGSPAINFNSDAWDIFNLLIDQAHRWRALDVISGYRHGLPEDRFSYSISLPSLSMCNNSQRNGSASDSLPEKSFPCCPSLQILGLAYLRPTHNIYEILRGLSILELETYKGCSVAHLLGRCPLLRSLTIQKFHLDDDSFCSPCYTHTNLLTLNVTIGDSFAMGVWDAIRLPNLTKLEISFGDLAFAYNESEDRMTYFDKEDKNVLDEVQEMVVRSQCILEIMRVYTETSDGFEVPSDVVDVFIHSIPRPRSNVLPRR
ncbi:hypothetical protein GYMLUDRAFT_50427 [Collybiopsis luxurians FD-317 M1]|uniref:F-box domain-containing protein n=1 Tax=Collybiopsis luxurians FD-317 M1 TaxID=944289 RepID=A0A0D0BPT0_9AGAR|nr:hypothetical protein GYMLUDRAFT_50427 [Collybiopsis luxurians FD-317 M1]